MGKILIADDEPAITKLLGFLLSSKGHKVTTASDGGEATRLARLDPPDLLISDVRMPNVSGYDLMRIVQREFPGTKCILMSGGTDFGDAKVRAEIRDLVLCGTFKKPFVIKDLLKVVEAALADPSRTNQ